MRLMTKDERFEKGNETESKALEMLEKYHNCLMVRVTGFGKTYHLIQIAKQYDKVYYIVPRLVIVKDIKDSYNLSDINIEFLTYQKISSVFRKNAQEYFFEDAKKYDRVLFILDEVHCGGATETANSIYGIKEMFPDAYYIGATATPERSDKFNLNMEFFEGHALDRYDIKDAIEDGFFARPKYIYAVYELKKDLENLKETVSNSNVSDEVKNNILDEINKYMIQYNMILGVPDIIRNNLDLRKKYFKFFVFFPTKDALFSKYNTVIEWFEEAFPEYTINNTIIVSEGEYRKNINDLDKMCKRSYNIDLIFCVDMLNMGYHVDDVSGIIMMRSTTSDIVYLQQIGRCFSASSNTNPVILDLVGNYNKSQEYGEYARMALTYSKKEIGEFDEDCMEATDYVTDISNIMRIWSNTIKDNPKIYADAYDHKNAPIKFAMNGMNCRTVKQFAEMLKIYGYSLKQKDLHLLTE